MRVCYIYYSFYPANVPFYVHTQKLAGLGCQVHAIALRREGEALRERVEQVWVERVVEFEMGGNARLSFPRFLWSAYRTLSRLDAFDIVHITNLLGVSLFSLLARNKAGGWVLDIRSPPLHGRWRSLISNFRIRAEARAFDAVFVHSQAVGEAIFAPGSKRFIELPIGVDLNHFTPGRNPALRAELGVDSHEVLLIYTGSLQPDRMLDKMLLGFHRANTLLGNLHLLILGMGTDETRLRALAKDLYIGDKVHFQGFVPYPQMPAYLHAADIGLAYVPITPWFDKAPVLKTMEMLAAGLPTIATATQGNRAYISHGENGLLVEDSPEAIAAGIVELCRSSDLSGRFQSARESVRAYDWNRIVEDILAPTYLGLHGVHSR